MTVVESSKLDFSKFDFKEIFSVVYGTRNMRGNHERFIKSCVCDSAFATYSNNQLRYIGDTKKGEKLGVDFVGINSKFRFEFKSLKNLFDKKGRTKEIIMKSFHGTTKIAGQQFSEWQERCGKNKPFDFLVLYDTTNYIVAISSWENVFCRCFSRNSIISTKLEKNDYEIVVENVEPYFRKDFKRYLKKMCENYILLGK